MKNHININNMTEEEKKAYEKLKGKFKLVPKKERIKQRSKKSGSDSKNIITHTVGILKQPLYTKTFVVTTILFGILYTFLYGLWKVPIIDFGFNRFSNIGILDYAFLVIISLIAGSVFSLMKYERSQSIKSGSKAAGGGSLLAGIISAICPVCQGISIAALGSTVAIAPLAFLVPYIGLIQIITIFILGFAFYLKADSIFTQTCITCKVDTKIEHKVFHK